MNKTPVITDEQKGLAISVLRLIDRWQGGTSWQDVLAQRPLMLEATIKMVILDQMDFRDGRFLIMTLNADWKVSRYAPGDIFDNETVAVLIRDLSRQLAVGQWQRHSLSCGNMFIRVEQCHE